MKSTHRNIPPLVVGIDEAAAMLDVSRWTVMRLCDEGELHSTKVGRLRKIPVSDIHRLIAQNEVTTSACSRSKKNDGQAA